MSDEINVSIFCRRPAARRFIRAATAIHQRYIDTGFERAAVVVAAVFLLLLGY